MEVGSTGQIPCQEEVWCPGGALCFGWENVTQVQRGFKLPQDFDYDQEFANPYSEIKGAAINSDEYGQGLRMLDPKKSIGCSSCAQGYYGVGGKCNKCPSATLSDIQTVGVIAFIVVCMLALLKFSGANSYVSGTKFTHELAPKDEIQLMLGGKVNKPGQLVGFGCTYEYYLIIALAPTKCVLLNDAQRQLRRRVRKVLHDYQLEVDRNFDNAELLTSVKFKIRKYHKTGQGKWIDGSGLVTIPPKNGIILGGLWSNDLDGWRLSLEVKSALWFLPVMLAMPGQKVARDFWWSLGWSVTFYLSWRMLRAGWYELLETLMWSTGMRSFGVIVNGL